MTVNLSNAESNDSRRRAHVPLSLPGGGTMVLRPVTKLDQDFLLSVYASSREKELAQVEWGEGQKEFFVRRQFETQQREYETRFPDARYDVILVDGQPAGRIWVGADEKQIRLLDIAILSDFQNRGVGTTLLNQLIEEARSANKRLRHMVFVLNDDAYRFYERLGFVIIEDLGAYKHMEWRPKELSADYADSTD
jgi:ribosomal protein S18 acetylase RimI-like enzyme